MDTLDDSFALELSEFGNETVDLDIPLAIPEKSKTWPGIIGDSQYRLRLDVKCQCVDICDNMSSDDTVSHAEILLKTNSPPVVTDVMVSRNSTRLILWVVNITIYNINKLYTDP